MTAESYTHLLKEVLIGRQPILDLHQELMGYELLFRSANVPAEIPGCGLTATASVVCTVFSELGIGDSLGSHKAFINADEAFILDDVVELLPANSVVLELNFDTTPNDMVLTRCRQLRDRGYTLALARYTGLDARASALLPLVGIVKELGAFDLPFLFKDEAAFRNTTASLGVELFKKLEGKSPTEYRGHLPSVD